MKYVYIKQAVYNRLLRGDVIVKTKNVHPQTDTNTDR
jgi:hypothetical protein